MLFFQRRKLFAMCDYVFKTLHGNIFLRNTERFTFYTNVFGVGVFFNFTHLQLHIHSELVFQAFWWSYLSGTFTPRRNSVCLVRHIHHKRNRLALGKCQSCLHPLRMGLNDFFWITLISKCLELGEMNPSLKAQGKLFY